MRTLLLAHMGGPESPEQLPDFLKSIFLDRDLVKLPLRPLTGRLLARLRLPEARRHYGCIGGASPLPGLTRALAARLSAVLSDPGVEVRAVYTHAHPGLPASGVGLLVLPLYPQYSKVLAGAIERRLPGAKVLGSWHLEPAFLNCLEARLRAVLKGRGPGDTALLFLAHGLPLSAAADDIYVGQVQETFKAMASRFPGWEARLAYIGKAGPAEWTGPQAYDELAAMKSAKGIAAQYLSLPLDNVETLYDIDVALGNRARELGFGYFARAASPNDGNDFAAALAELVRGRLL